MRAANSTLPVLVDFWAPWCGPCKMVAPEVAKAAQITVGRVVVAKLNTESVPEIAQRYSIHSIPTFILFANGNEKSRLEGGRSSADLVRFAAS